MNPQLKHAFFALLFLLVGLCNLGYSQSDALSLGDFLKLEKKVVSVAKKCMSASVGLGSKDRPENGSAVVVSKDGLLLTAYHVVQGLPDKDMIVSFVDGRKVKARKLGGVPKLDIAMAQITEPGEYPYVEIGDYSDVSLGDWCVSISHAAGFKEDRTPPVRLGRVMNKNRNGFLQVSSTLIGGDSGGPTFDLEGRVIGIHSNIGGSLNQNQACPISDFTKEDHWQRLLDGEVWGKPGEDKKKANKKGGKKKDGEEKAESDKAASDKAASDKAASDKAESDKAESDKAESDDNSSAEESSESGAESDDTETGDRDDDTQESGKKVKQESEAEMAQSSVQEPETKGDSKTEAKDDQNQQKSDSNQETEEPASKPTEQAEQKKPAKKPSVKQEPKKIVTSLEGLDILTKRYAKSVVRFWRRGRLITSGTIVSEDGLIVTKSSELLSRHFEIELPDGNRVRGEVVRRFKENDLLFVRVPGRHTPVRFDRETATEVTKIPLGSLVAAVGYGGKPVAMGVKSVEIRNLYESGYGVLGVQLGNKQDDLSVKGLGGGDSAAKKAGLRKGDKIVSIGGEKMESLDQLRAKLRSLKPNSRVPVEFERDGRQAATLVKLGSSLARDDKAATRGYPQGGRISRNRTEFTNAFQSDTPFDPKDVGAPLIDLHGNLIGLNIARAGRIKSYTLPCQTVLEEIEKLTSMEQPVD